MDLDIHIKRLNKARKTADKFETWEDRETLQAAEKDLEAWLNRFVDARIDRKVSERYIEQAVSTRLTQLLERISERHQDDAAALRLVYIMKMELEQGKF